MDCDNVELLNRLFLPKLGRQQHHLPSLSPGGAPKYPFLPSPHSRTNTKFMKLQLQSNLYLPITATAVVMSTPRHYCFTPPPPPLSGNS